MFASAIATTPHAHAGAYSQVSVLTGVAAASPHQLVQMLFDGVDESLLQALGALDSGVVETKCKAIGRALRIVNEGLKANLDLDSGGTLARGLHELYGYVGTRLLHAQLHNDAAALQECRRLLHPLREAWALMVDNPQRAA